MKLRGDIGLLLLLDVGELGLKGGQMVAAQLQLAFICVGLHRGHVLAQKDLLRQVEVGDLHRITGHSTIARHRSEVNPPHRACRSPGGA